MGAALRLTAALHGNREALVGLARNRRWTWAQRDAAVDALARSLLDAGVAS